MKKIFLATMLSFVMFYSLTAYAAEFKFIDGTLIRGEIQGEKLRIKTKFGELTPKVSEFVFVSGGKIELTDGSQVMGELLPEAVSPPREQGTETSAPAQKKGLLLKTKYGTFELLFSMGDIDYIDFKK
jgi:hypothetical protein